MTDKQKKGRGLKDWLENAILRLMIFVCLAMPYRMRVPAMGWLTRRIIAPLAGYHDRSMKHLAYIFPDMPEMERRAIAMQVADNMGRTFIENYSRAALRKRVARAPLSGDGLIALEKAARDKRPVLLVSGHFGNYEAARTALVERGYEVGGLYRAAQNAFFNDHYKETMQFGGPVFEQSRAGTSGFVRHLKNGGFLVLLFDIFSEDGEHLDLLGKTANTVTSAADLALRYGADLIPFYATRQPNGLDFDIELEAPIAHTTPSDMMQALNDSLGARIRKNPGQWFWVHRRWRPSVVKRQRKLAEARISP